MCGSLVKTGIGYQIYRTITRDLLIGQSSFLRRSISRSVITRRSFLCGSKALNPIFRFTQKRALNDQYRRRRRRKTYDHSRNVLKKNKNRQKKTESRKNVFYFEKTAFRQLRFNTFFSQTKDTNVQGPGKILKYHICNSI